MAEDIKNPHLSDDEDRELDKYIERLGGVAGRNEFAKKLRQKGRDVEDLAAVPQAPAEQIPTFTAEQELEIAKIFNAAFQSGDPEAYLLEHNTTPEEQEARRRFEEAQAA